jgi:hypothetical protein
MWRGETAMKILVIFGLLTVGAMAQDVKHAPTAAQCQADIAVWKAESKVDIEALAVNALVGRANELSDCSKVLVGDGSEWALTLRAAYDQHIEKRYVNFLIRHGFGQQMVDEDAKGAR